MKLSSILLLTSVVSGADTAAFNVCDKAAAATCVTDYCCSANTYRGDPVDPQTYLTELCMPSGYGTTQTSYTDNSTTSALISGGAVGDVYTYSC